MELYNQIKVLVPTLFEDFRQFGMRYCDGKLSNWGGWDWKGASNLAELHVLLSRFVMIRRLKEKVLTQLPAKRRQIITIDVPKGQCSVNKITVSICDSACTHLWEGGRYSDYGLTNILIGS
jgi:hypothetical protein